ncbi:hypothetical protein C5167_040179 [Papaver somniferum]|uniref:Uncharacterized protein n=1 Tax=Papaver somniferum TaxID=3469 RepID=A0A4Y7IGN3_PAPSO|nr:hypothetical protein C5167_040179 [Papaver somniferum]
MKNKSIEILRNGKKKTKQKNQLPPVLPNPHSDLSLIEPHVQDEVVDLMNVSNEKSLSVER